MNIEIIFSFQLTCCQNFEWKHETSGVEFLISLQTACAQFHFYIFSIFPIFHLLSIGCISDGHLASVSERSLQNTFGILVLFLHSIHTDYDCIFIFNLISDFWLILILTPICIDNCRHYFQLHKLVVGFVYLNLIDIFKRESITITKRVAFT